MTRNAGLLQATLVLTLTLVVNSIAAADLMDAYPLRCAKQQRPCESPISVRPDTYCGKPRPCVVCLPGCRRCDDHCLKGIPCVPCLPQAYRCNDYRGKCFPPVCPIRLIGPGCASSCGEGDGGTSIEAESW